MDRRSVVRAPCWLYYYVYYRWMRIQAAFEYWEFNVPPYASATIHTLYSITSVCIYIYVREYKDIDIWNCTYTHISMLNGLCVSKISTLIQVRVHRLHIHTHKHTLAHIYSLIQWQYEYKTTTTITQRANHAVWCIRCMLFSFMIIASPAYLRFYFFRASPWRVYACM